MESQLRLESRVLISYESSYCKTAQQLTSGLVYWLTLTAPHPCSFDRSKGLGLSGKSAFVPPGLQ